MKKTQVFAIGASLLALTVSVGLVIKGVSSLTPSVLLSPEVASPEQLDSQSGSSPLNLALASPTPTASPSASPSPTPLSFADQNKLYGPCTVLPTLMYHHIQDLGIAKSENHASLTVDTKIFHSQMQYLHDKGYNVLPVSSLIAFFENGTAIPKKSVLLTFDDGYDDFASDAAPILASFNFPGVMFVPTGLLENPGYMHWSQVQSIASGQPILMANHTWSHHNMGASKSVIEKEIGTADTQLHDHNQNNPKVFAYPYGISSPYAEAYLAQQGYHLAFTTVHGSTLCKQQRFELPRIRIGNAPLSSYGL